MQTREVLARILSPALHVYGQYVQHDDAAIVGTREALEDLARAIKSVLQTGYAEAEFQARDGEEYSVVAVRVETVDDLPLPYTAEYASDPDGKRWEKLADLKLGTAWQQIKPKTWGCVKCGRHHSRVVDGDPMALCPWCALAARRRRREALGA